MPDTVNVDANNVNDIIIGYKKLVDYKKKKLKVAIVFSVLSIISICIGIIGYNVKDPNKKLKEEIQIAKMKKDLHDQIIIPKKPQQILNDSIKSINDYYDVQIENILKKQKLNCIENKDKKCLDSIKLFEK